MRAVFMPAVALLLGGCALWGGAEREASRASPEPERGRRAVREVPPNPELERSRALISQAAKDPTVNSHFKDDLERARAALDQALIIWNEERGKLDEDDEEWQEIRHLNYQARQRTALVVMKARGLDAQRGLGELKSQHKRVLAHAPKPEAVPARGAPVTTELPPALQGLNPRQEPRGLVLTLDDRYFGEDQGLVNSDAVFAALVQYLVANPGKVVACEGHSDAGAGESLGQRLSQQRARVVQEALLERGLEFSRITAVGYGSSRPRSWDQGEDAGRNNRRVEIVIIETVPANFSADES